MISKCRSYIFAAYDAVTLTLDDRKHSLLSDVKEFSTIIRITEVKTRRASLVIPVLLSKAADAITILDLEQ